MLAVLYVGLSVISRFLHLKEYSKFEVTRGIVDSNQMCEYLRSCQNIYRSFSWFLFQPCSIPVREDIRLVR